ncbi:1-phosphofructokinase, partial [Salmonella enterica subsp. enterica serovar Kentucky]|nr:1-phosphofructokinase [Salmonella enterica subsp. enterica serovar Kentucky]
MFAAVKGNGAESPEIYTLTLNSAIDMNIFSDPLQPNIV